MKGFQYKLLIPSAITSLNLVAGLIAILLVFKGEFRWAGYSIIGASVLDFLDGFVARALKATSDFGKELDSLADVVTFGVAPGFLMYGWDLNLQVLPNAQGQIDTYLWSWLCLILPVFAALRLAWFNIDSSQKEGFRGIPTPAMSLFFVGICFLGLDFPDSWIAQVMQVRFVIPILCCVFALLMVIPLPLLALKFNHGFGIKKNAVKYLLIGISLGALLLWQISAFSGIILFYLVVSGISRIKLN
ncbi:MAG: CDP-diacylglycerol--serine O-phosphatidyltransferase [Sphingobacteriia bacterium]|nr:CDP-diacylglycerol--serine O-phosphatidyltransferase [Sphingobacteriia bacterium]